MSAAGSVRILDASVHTPSLIDVLMAWLWGVILAALFAGIVFPVMDLVFKGIGIDMPSSYASDVLHRRFFMFLFIEFALNIVLAAGITPAKSPKAYILCVVCVFLLVLLR